MSTISHEAFRRFLQHIADAVAPVLQLEVTVVDTRGVRVVGTGAYSPLVGQAIPQSSSMAEVMRTGKPALVVRPGQDAVCYLCEGRQNCTETCHIAYPLMDNRKPLGVLALVGFNDVQQHRMLAQHVQYLSFAKSMSDLVEMAARGAHILELIQAAGRIHASVETSQRAVPRSSLVDDYGSGAVSTGVPGRTREIQAQKAQFIDNILGQAPALLEAKRLALSAAAGQAAVLLRGESGTGKELFARAIHCHSQRRRGPFVVVNCAAIPEELLESELLGYEDGAFTGARKGGKPGKFELADGGTLFLDEVGDCSLRLQAKLLRALDSGEIQRVGATRATSVDVRIVAATNQDLEDSIGLGKFRRDLYFRLNVIPISLPSLRDRPGDILPLFEHFVTKFASGMGRPAPLVGSSTRRILRLYRWPGNVRELQNTARYALYSCTGGVIEVRDLPPQLRARAENGKAPTRASPDVERQMILEGLSRLGNTPRAKEALAKQLGLGRSTIYRKIREYGLQ